MNLSLYHSVAAHMLASTGLVRRSYGIYLQYLPRMSWALVPLRRESGP